MKVQWDVGGGMLHLNWEECGGPPVSPPKQMGFGSRLLEEVVAHDLGGCTRLDYDRAGVRCRISVVV